MLDLENFDQKFKDIVNSNEWTELEKYFKNAKHVFLFGNGGNLAVADHAAIDISRLTDKNALAPGSGITATSIIGDTSAQNWFKKWLEYRLRGLEPAQCLVVGFSCSTTGTSSESLVSALNYAHNQGVNSALISAQPKQDLEKGILNISQNVSLYHTSEVLSLAMTYKLIHSADFECPSIFKKARQRKFEKLGIKSEQKEGEVK